MKRSDFITTLKEITENLGLGFQHGFLYRMNEGVIRYPLFWLCPIEMTDRKTDSNESYTAYSVEAYLHNLNDKFNEYDKECVWQEQEDCIFNICGILSENEDVAYVVNIRCEPDEFRFRDGTISMKVTFDIQLYHCE